MRFRDFVTFLNDDASFEEKHPRDRKSGEFIGNNSTIKKDSTNNAEKSKAEISKGIQSIRQQFNKGEINAAKALRLSAKLLRGTYYSDVEGLKGVPLRLGREFLNETGKYVNAPEVKSGKISVKEIVNRQMFAYENLDYLLKHGRLVSKWRHSKTHHPDLDFIVLRGRIDKGNGKSSRFYTLDIFRKHQPNSTSKPEEKRGLYNISSEGFPGSNIKKKYLKLDDSNLSYGILNIEVI